MKSKNEGYSEKFRRQVLKEIKEIKERKEVSNASLVARENMILSKT